MTANTTKSTKTVLTQRIAFQLEHGAREAAKAVQDDLDLYSKIGKMLYKASKQTPEVTAAEIAAEAKAAPARRAAAKEAEDAAAKRVTIQRKLAEEDARTDNILAAARKAVADIFGAPADLVGNAPDYSEAMATAEWAREARQRSQQPNLPPKNPLAQLEYQLAKNPTPTAQAIVQNVSDWPHLRNAQTKAIIRQAMDILTPKPAVKTVAEPVKPRLMEGTRFDVVVETYHRPTATKTVEILEEKVNGWNEWDTPDGYTLTRLEKVTDDYHRDNTYVIVGGKVHALLRNPYAIRQPGRPEYDQATYNPRFAEYLANASGTPKAELDALCAVIQAGQQVKIVTAESTQHGSVVAQELARRMPYWQREQRIKAHIPHSAGSQNIGSFDDHDDYEPNESPIRKAKWSHDSMPAKGKKGTMSKDAAHKHGALFITYADKVETDPATGIETLRMMRPLKASPLETLETVINPYNVYYTPKGEVGYQVWYGDRVHKLVFLRNSKLTVRTYRTSATRRFIIGREVRNDIFVDARTGKDVVVTSLQRTSMDLPHEVESMLRKVVDAYWRIKHEQRRQFDGRTRRVGQRGGFMSDGMVNKTTGAAIEWSESNVLHEGAEGSRFDSHDESFLAMGEAGIDVIMASLAAEEDARFWVETGEMEAETASILSKSDGADYGRIAEDGKGHASYQKTYTATFERMMERTAAQTEKADVSRKTARQLLVLQLLADGIAQEKIEQAFCPTLRSITNSTYNTAPKPGKEKWVHGLMVPKAGTPPTTLIHQLGIGKAYATWVQPYKPTRPAQAVVGRVRTPLMQYLDLPWMVTFEHGHVLTITEQISRNQAHLGLHFDIRYLNMPRPTPEEQAASLAKKAESYRKEAARLKLLHQAAPFLLAPMPAQRASRRFYPSVPAERTQPMSRSYGRPLTDAEMNARMPIYTKVYTWADAIKVRKSHK